MKFNSPEIFKNVVINQGLYEFLMRPRTRTISVNEAGELTIFNLYDADYMKGQYKNKISIPDYDERAEVVQGTRIKIHANWAEGEDEVFWVRVALVDILPTGEKAFYTLTEYSTNHLPSDAVVGPVLVSNICDIDYANGLYTDGYQVSAFQSGVKNG